MHDARVKLRNNFQGDDRVELDSLNCLFINVRSILNNFKIEELNDIAVDQNLHIIGIAESWLNKDVDSSSVNMADFNLYRRDRDTLRDNRGGGVLLYVHKTLISSELVILNSFNCEVVGCNILLGKNKFSTFAVVYRSPSSSSVECEEIAKVLSVLGSNETVVIMGDFNHPGINWENYASSNNEEEKNS